MNNNKIITSNVVVLPHVYTGQYALGYRGVLDFK